MAILYTLQWTSPAMTSRLLSVCGNSTGHESSIDIKNFYEAGTLATSIAKPIFGPLGKNFALSCPLTQSQAAKLNDGYAALNSITGNVKNNLK